MMFGFYAWYCDQYENIEAFTESGSGLLPFFGTKPLPQTMLTYWELGSQKHIEVKFESIYCELQS